MIFSSLPDNELKENGFFWKILSRDGQKSNLAVQGEENFFPVERNDKPFLDIHRKIFGNLS